MPAKSRNNRWLPVPLSLQNVAKAPEQRPKDLPDAIYE